METIEKRVKRGMTAISDAKVRTGSSNTKDLFPGKRVESENGKRKNITK